jgi:glycosyltransferase involved in cell wall biosynthesis
VVGGPIEGVRQLALAAEEAGHHVEVVCVDEPGAPWLKDFPLKVYALGPSYLGYGYAPKLVPWLKAHGRDYTFVIVNGIWQYNSLAAWRVLRRLGVPYFVFTHGMLDPWFKKHYPFKHLKKWVYWPWAEYRVLRDATAVLFTCEEEKILARQSFWLYRCREEVVNYGIAGWKGDAEAQKAAFFARFPELRGKKLLLFLGRVHEKKGGDLLISAFHRQLTQKPDANLNLVMAGPSDNPFGCKLKRLCASLGVEDQVTWTGMLQGDEKWGAFLASDVFLLPSHQENFGVAVAEALSARLPVLISNKVNIWREIDEDKAGLVEANDAAGTSALLRRWLELSPRERDGMREAARRCFLAHFEIKATAQSLIELYARCQQNPTETGHDAG